MCCRLHNGLSVRLFANFFDAIDINADRHTTNDRSNEDGDGDDDGQKRKEKKKESEERENVEKTAKQLRSHYGVYLMNKFDFVPPLTKALFDFHKTSKLII